MPSDHRRLLSDTFIRGLKAAAPGQRIHHWDTRWRTSACASPTGARSRTSSTRGIRQPRCPHAACWVMPGKMSLAAARKQAREWLDLIEQGIDPQAVVREQQQAQQREQRTTFAVVAEDWLADAVRGKQRQGRTVELDLRREFIPRWGNRPITEITTLDVRDAIKEVKERAPSQARNILGHLKRLFAWAEAQHVYGIDQDPAERLKPKSIVGKEHQRQRVLTDTEMRALWLASPWISLRRRVQAAGTQRTA